MVRDGRSAERDLHLSDFAKLGRKISSALKSGGRFLLGYHDGELRTRAGYCPRQAVFQEAPERINLDQKNIYLKSGHTFTSSGIKRVARNTNERHIFTLYRWCA